MDNPDLLIPRSTEAVITEPLAAFRVVVLHGPRQAGKSTLAEMIADKAGAAYRTMDDEAERAAAFADPDGYVAAPGTPLFLDEVQRVGEPLILAVKRVVDRDPRPGRFLLTGSSNFLTVPTISETLAGRTDIVELWPLAQGELAGRSSTFVDRVFHEPLNALLGSDADPVSRQDYFEIVCRGGFPEVQHLTGRTRRRWFTAYLRTVLDREIEVARDVRDREALEATLRLLTATTAQELVMTNVARRVGIARDTAERYVAWLRRTFLVRTVPGWGRGLTSKVVIRPKVYAVDSGLAASIIGRDPSVLAEPTEPTGGPLLETLAGGELTSQLGWSNTQAGLFHFRERQGREVDLVIEAIDGRIVGVEVKATTTARSDDFKGLAFLRDKLDSVDGTFVVGVVLHTGSQRFSFGDRLFALPLSDLWS